MPRERWKEATVLIVHQSVAPSSDRCICCDVLMLMFRSTWQECHKNDESATKKCQTPSDMRKEQ